MTNINRKLFDALTTIAMLAPAAGAPAASYGTLHPARHFGISPSGRHFTAQSRTTLIRRVPARRPPLDRRLRRPP